jgi:hypothetical protein
VTADFKLKKELGPLPPHPLGAHLQVSDVRTEVAEGNGFEVNSPSPDPFQTVDLGGQLVIVEDHFHSQFEEEHCESVKSVVKIVVEGVGRSHILDGSEVSIVQLMDVEDSAAEKEAGPPFEFQSDLGCGGGAGKRQDP